MNTSNSIGDMVWVWGLEGKARGQKRDFSLGRIVIGRWRTSRENEERCDGGLANVQSGLAADLAPP